MALAAKRDDSLNRNKPGVDGFDIGVDLSVSTTEYGEESEAVETFINIPVNDRIALRAAMYSAEEGGYIDNVPGTFTTNPAVTLHHWLAPRSNMTQLITPLWWRKTLMMPNTERPIQRQRHD